MSADPQRGEDRRRADRISGSWPSYTLGLFALSMAGQLSFLIALRARELGADFQTIGLLAGVTASVPALFAIPGGAIVDRWGARRVFVLAALVAAVACGGMAFLDRVAGLFLLAPVAGTAVATAWTAVQSQVTGLAGGLARAVHTGRLSLFTNLGDMAGPLLAGTGAQFLGPGRAFLVPATYALLFTAVGWAGLPQRTATGTRTIRGVGVGEAYGLLRRAPMQVALLLTSARLWIQVVYLTFLPVYLVDQGIGAGRAGTVMATSGLVAAVTAPLAAGAARRWSQRRVTTVALAGGAAVVAVTPALANIPGAYVIVLFVGLGSGLSLPLLLSLTTSAAPEGHRGIALGLRATVNQVAAAAAPMAVGPVLTGAGAIAGFASGGGAAVVLLGLATVRHRHTGLDGTIEGGRRRGRQARRPPSACEAADGGP